MGRVWSIIRFRVFGMVLALSMAAGLFFLQPATVGYHEEKLINTDSYSAIELELLLEAYKTKIVILGNQAREIEKDIDWLILKINRLQDAGQKSPRDLVASVTAKEEKIKILFKEKTRLEHLSSIYSKSYDLRMKTEHNQILADITGSQKMEAEVKTEKVIVAETIVAKKSFPAVQKKKSLPKPVPVQSSSTKKSKIQAAIKRADLDDWVFVNGDDTCLRIETTLPILFSSAKRT